MQDAAFGGLSYINCYQPHISPLIFADNIMMTEKMEPVLIDFSLAKFVDQGLSAAKSFKTNGRHTGDCGTATFMAPEVYAKKSYGIKAGQSLCACIACISWSSAPLLFISLDVLGRVAI